MMRRSLRSLKREGFRYIHTFNSPDEVEVVSIERQPLWNNRKHETGPFDIIGDIHGCCDELEVLLQQLGYEITAQIPSDSLWGSVVYSHPQGRKVIFLGDLVDRGPRILDALKLVYNMVEAGTALCVPGNHDVKLMRKLRGKDVKITHGLNKSIAEIDALSEDIRDRFRKELLIS